MMKSDHSKKEVPALTNQPFALSRNLQLFFIVFFLTLVAVVAATFLSYQSSSELVQRKVAKSSLEAVTQTAHQVDQYLQSLIGLSTQIRMNPLVMNQVDLLQSGKLTYNEAAQSRQIVGDLLNSYRDSDRQNIYSIALIPKVNYVDYADNGRMVLGNIMRSYPGPSIRFDSQSSKWFDQIITADGELVWFPSREGGFFGFSYMPTMTVGRVMKNLKDPSKEVVLLIEVKAETLYQLISRLDLGEDDAVFMTDRTHHYTAVKDLKLLTKEALFAPADAKQAIGDGEKQAIHVRPSDGQDVLVVHAPSEITGWQVYGYFPVSEVTGEMMSMFVWMLAGVLLMGIVLVLASILSTRFVRMYRKSQQYVVEIERQNEQLNEMARLKDEFLANTSHELRTPLNGIIGLSESLIDGATGDLPSATNYNLEMIVSSGRRLLNLVNDILDFSKLKHKELQLDLTPIDVHEIVELVNTMFRPMANLRGIQLLNQVDRGMKAAEADPNRFQQILYNLIGNALKFTESGSITVSAQMTGSMVVIHVKDTGVGIPPEMHERIFESFEQLEGGTTRKAGGTGLGLAVTKKLVEVHGGTIGVNSTVGNGSTFSFTLPATDEKPVRLMVALEQYSGNKLADAEDGTDDLKSISGSEERTNDDYWKLMHGARVLVVDDEPVNLQVLENHLHVQRCTVYQAMNGQEALDLISQMQQPPDLVVLDVMMPGMSGYEVAQTIRRTYSAAELPIILLTAKNQIQDLMTGFESGANDYLVKPFTKNELLSRIKLHLQLLFWNRHLDEQVRERTQDLRNLLDYAGQGFLSFGPDLKVDDAYSAECARIIESTIAGRTVSDLLFPRSKDTYATVTNILNRLFETKDPARRELVFGLLPEDTIIGGRFIRLQFRLIEDTYRTVRKIMLVLTDDTEKMKMKNEMEAERLRLRMIVQTVTHRKEAVELINSYKQFAKEYEMHLRSSTGTSRDRSVQILRSLHTYKGSFAQYGFVHAPVKLHQAEEKVIRLLDEGGNPQQLIQLLKQEDLTIVTFEDMNILRDALGDSFFEVNKTIEIDPLRIRGIEMQMELMLPEEERKPLIVLLKELYYVSLKESLAGYEEETLNLANRNGKSIAPFVIEGDDWYVDPDLATDWIKSLVHIFRNTVDHGIESYEDRVLAGKNGTGQIIIDLSKADGFYTMTISDDGQGMSVPKLRQKARNLGIIPDHIKDEQMPDERVFDYVFHPLFSSKETVGEISGRGIGLNAVRETTTHFGGTVKAESKHGQWTRLIFRFPEDHSNIMTGS